MVSLNDTYVAFDSYSPQLALSRLRVQTCFELLNPQPNQCCSANLRRLNDNNISTLTVPSLPSHKRCSPPPPLTKERSSMGRVQAPHRLASRRSHPGRAAAKVTNKPGRNANFSVFPTCGCRRLTFVPTCNNTVNKKPSQVEQNEKRLSKKLRICILSPKTCTDKEFI